MAEKKQSSELIIQNKKLNIEKKKKANELKIANKEIASQHIEKSRIAKELEAINKELAFQNIEKEKNIIELKSTKKELEIQNKEIQKIEEKLTKANLARTLIEASNDPLFTINLAGKITDLNDAAANITSRSRELLIGTDFFDYFTEPDKAKKVYKEIFKKGFVVDYPLTIRDLKNTEVLFNGSIYKNDLGDVAGVVVVARDSTEQKKIEKELIEARIFAELATEMAEQTQKKSEVAMMTAENAVKSKQQFLSNMSHEIRTPMNAIIGFTKVVLKTELNAKQREYLSAIKVSGDALIVLINDILDLAKVDAGKMTFEEMPFKMLTSLNAMLQLFDTRIKEKNLKLIVKYDENIPEILVGDTVRLHQIIMNLVSNAVKFTSNGNITIQIDLISEDNEMAVIDFAVSDTGIGIPENKLKNIFDNFQQATSETSRIYGGTGLGLAIVKQLVEKQNGEIKVESKINEGSVFSFRLTFKKNVNDLKNNTIEPEIEKEIIGVKVLVVEDIELNQLLMKTLLEEFKFESEIASNGKIAIQKLAKQTFDVILMDLQMPEMNGFEATKYIRNILKLNVPIIALTADVTTVDLEKCKAVGMNDFIAKPVDENILYAKIIEIIKNVNKIEEIMKKEELIVQASCINLSYLLEKTKSNPKLMAEMIKVYLEQTPLLIAAMKKGYEKNDWALVKSAAHKMIPSFSIVGIDNSFEEMARKIQEFSEQQELSDKISDMVTQLENVCLQACKELEQELKNISNE
jgi:PAS domain S-box-containing protein